jgi:hypothetical protein
MQMTPDDLQQHLIAIEETTDEMLREAIIDLLVASYPAKVNQDN